MANSYRLCLLVIEKIIGLKMAEVSNLAVLTYAILSLIKLMAF